MPLPNNYVSNMRDGVIYSRVSSTKQLIGHGLESQIKHCTVYAERNGINILQVFREEGISGATAMRPSLSILYEFAENYQKLHNGNGRTLVVLLYDVSRLSREMQGYHLIKKEIEARGGTVEYVTQTFDNTYSGRFVENIMVAYGEMDRHKNAERTRDKMAARTMEGFWVYASVPFGYMPSEIKGIKKQDPRSAPIVRQVLEGYAQGQYKNFTEIANYLNSQNLLNYKGKVRTFDGESAKNLIKWCWFYAGFVQCPKRAISRRQGKHESIISTDTLDMIEKRLAGKKISPYRKNSAHFPLRGHINCSECGKPLTAAFCGKGRKYGYYYCRTHDCYRKNANIPYKDLHERFCSLLTQTLPTLEIIEKTQTIFKEVWKKELSELSTLREEWGRELKCLDESIQGCVDQLISSKSSHVEKAVTKRLDELSARQAVLKVKINEYQSTKDDFENVLDKVMNLLKTPMLAWKDSDLATKKTIQRLIFPKGLTYDTESENFRKPEKALLFWFIGKQDLKKAGMVHPGGFEPPTA